MSILSADLRQSPEANFARYGVTCSICERPAAASCDWPAVELVPVEARSVKKGDVVSTASLPKYYPTNPRAQVVYTYEHPDKIRTIAMDVGRGVYHYLFTPGTLLHVERPGRCGAIVCDCHLREVAETRRYCCSHWHLQEDLWLRQ
jgi:hypothetical protein